MSSPSPKDDSVSDQSKVENIENSESTCIEHDGSSNEQQNETSSLEQNETSSLEQNETSSLEQNETSSLEQNEISSLEQNEISSLVARMSSRSSLANITSEPVTAKISVANITSEPVTAKISVAKIVPKVTTANVIPKLVTANVLPMPAKKVVSKPVIPIPDLFHPKPVPSVTLDPATLNFFAKRSFICPNKIRTSNIRKVMKQKSAFKLNLPTSIQAAPTVFADDVPYIFRLPEKLRIKIFQYISTEERTQTLQLVNRQISTEVRLRVGIQSFIDETTRNGPTFKRDIIVDTVIVGKYSSPLVSPKNLFIHPKNVKELVFLHPICIQHLDAFLTRCHQLRKLSIKNYIIRSLAPSTLTARELKAFEWRALETIHKYPIKMECLQDLIISMSPPVRALTAIPYILDLINPIHLKRFSIRVVGKVPMVDTKKVHFLVINFIKRLKKLTHILVSTDQNDRYEWKSHDYFGFPHEQLIEMGRKMKLRQMIMTEPCVAFHCWCPIMVVQKCLEVFQVTHIMGWAIPREVILRNAETLRKIAIHVILWANSVTHTPLNLGIFSRCVCLNELYICIAEPYKPGQIDVTNFQELPSSLDTFLLKDGTYLTKDFDKIATSLPNLETLGVHLNCKKENCGPTSGSIQKFLRMRKLNELFIALYNLVELKKREGQVLGNSEEFLTALNTIDARVKVKPRTIHVHDVPFRWISDNNGYVCSLTPEWGTIR